MVNRVLTLILLATLAAPASAAVDAAGFEDLAKLEGRLVGALDADIGTPGGPATRLDRRLKLQPCPSPVTIDPPALGAVALRCEALGWRIRVPLMKTPQQLQQQVAVVPAPFVPAQPLAPPVIKRGDPIELVASSNGFTVSTQAVAQEDGRVGGRVRVKADPRSQQVIIGDVVDAGRVRVSSF